MHKLENLAGVHTHTQVEF